MLKSMTGFGTSICELSDKKICVEIKSLNSKQLDIYVKLPQEYYGKEADVRNLIMQRIERGKVFLTITKEYKSDNELLSSVINQKLARSYYDEIKSLQNELGIDTDVDYMTMILRMPDVLHPAEQKISEDEWDCMVSSINSALDEVHKFGLDEGEHTLKELVKRSEQMKLYLKEVEPFEHERIEKMRQKLLKDIRQFIEDDKIDRNRFEQEILYYLEKFDISEEKNRLNKHFEYFLETINDSSSSGKKLAFICQEIGREINTIGSKANHAGIQRLVVNMKDELEKIKEQLMNIV